MSDPFVPLFLKLEEQMRRAGHGAMVDRALLNARHALLAVLRGELQRRRERAFVKGLIQEAIAPPLRVAGRLDFFLRKPPFPGAKH